MTRNRATAMPATRQHGANLKDRGGFRNLGQYALALVAAAQGHVDPRLRNLYAPIIERGPGGLYENEPAFGGFGVPTTYLMQIVGSLYADDVIGRTWLINPDGPIADVRLPAIDEQSRADGSRFGGIASAWLSEAAEITAAGLTMRLNSFSAHKIIAVVRLTDELMRDAVVLSAFLEKAVPQELAFRQTAALISGNGTAGGTPLGILNAPATIEVAKESGQAAGTIMTDNVRKMWKRMPAPCRRRAVWLVHEDATDQLDQLYDTVGTSAVNSRMLTYPTSDGAGYATLKGAPVIEVEQCPPLGTKGDIILADLSAYAMVHGNLASAVSAHVQFLSDEIFLRFVLRCDGMPVYASPITPYQGSTTRSPFVVLGDRS